MNADKMKSLHDFTNSASCVELSIDGLDSWSSSRGLCHSLNMLNDVKAR